MDDRYHLNVPKYYSVEEILITKTNYAEEEKWREGTDGHQSLK